MFSQGPKSKQYNDTSIFHGRIIKWTQHIDILTLIEMVRVVEGNHGNDSKRR